MKNKLRMLGKIAILCLLVSATSCGSSKKEGEGSDKSPSAESNVKKFSSTDGKFMIHFDAAPQETNQKIPTPAGDIDTHMFVYQKSATEAYQVAYSDFPSEVVKAQNPDTLLMNSMNGAASNVKAKITEQKKMEVNGNPGIWFLCNADQLYFTYKIILVGNRLYQINMIRDGSPASEESVKGFMDSFELVK
jgi:hypothetical protein